VGEEGLPPIAVRLHPTVAPGQPALPMNIISDLAAVESGLRVMLRYTVE
jgi:hypothetical protein